MSFWQGLAAGMDAAQQKRDKAEAIATASGRYADGQSRKDRAEKLAAEALAKADRRYEEEQRIKAEDREYDRARTDKADKRADITFEQSQKDREMENAIRMAQIFGTNVPTGSVAGSTKKSPPAVPSAKALEGAMISFNDWAGDREEMSEEGQNYFNTIGNDGKAAAAAMDFITTQSGKGNVVTPETLPKLLRLAGVLEGEGKEGYKKLQATLSRGEFDFEDPEAVVAGIIAMKKYTPDQILLNQVAPAPEQITDVKAYENAVKHFAPHLWEAYEEAESLGDKEKMTQIREMLGQIESDNESLHYKAFRNAIRAGIGVDALREQGLEGNPYMPAFPEFVEQVVPDKSPEVMSNSPSMQMPGGEEVGSAVATPTQAQQAPLSGDVGSSLSEGAQQDSGVSVSKNNSAPVKGDLSDLTPIEEAFLWAYEDPNIGEEEKAQLFQEAVDMHPNKEEGVQWLLDTYGGQSVEKEPEGKSEATARREDGDALVEALNDPRVDAEIREALKNEYEKIYGVGSVEEAIELSKLR